MKKSIVYAGFVLLMAVGAAAGWRAVEDADEGSGQLLAYRDAEVVALGRAIYSGNCASCHGVGLEGQKDWRSPDAEGYLPAPPHDETGHTWHHPDALLIDIATRGTEAVVGRGYRSRMPAFEDTLSSEEIAAALAYIKSTWPADVIETHNEINRRSAEQ